MSATDPGTLYIVATPIGNLEDITFRAVRVLAEVGLVACEDTRRTRKLMTTYNIRNHVISLRDYNEERKAAVIIARLQAGINVAYVTDAGTPAISDPGFALLRAALAAGVRVAPVPGPSAVIAALSVSGLPTNSFTFLGFPPHRPSLRRRFLSSLVTEPRTLVFYESPLRVQATISEMASLWGPRPCVLARELTKVFEEIFRGTLTELAEQLRNCQPRGEWTIVVGGHQEEPTADALTEEELIARFRELQSQEGLSRREAVDRLAAETGLPRRQIYRTIHAPETD